MEILFKTLICDNQYVSAKLLKEGAISYLDIPELLDTEITTDILLKNHKDYFQYHTGSFKVYKESLSKCKLVNIEIKISDNV